MCPQRDGVVMINAEQFNEMYELFDAVREEVITDEQFSMLNQLLAENKQICKYYIEYMNMSALLKSGKVFDKKQMLLSLSEMDSSLCDLQLWQEMAEYEKTSPEIKITLKKAKEELIRKVQRQKQEHKISKGSLLTLFTAAAAIILIFVFARFAPKAGIEVATLADSMNAKWADTYASMSTGTRFKTNSDKYFLREGLVKLVFDSEARITLEGPVEFQILTEDQVKLHYGRLYATVPQGAIGFTVNTPSARIIDLGTEFGIEAAASGDTYLHVIKGKTTLIAGQKSNKISTEVSQGDAKKVSEATSSISNIPCNSTLFVREINSSYKIAWKGQKTLDLADVVMNGNGLGTGNSEVRLNHEKGFTNEIRWGYTSTFKTYLPIKDHPFIDGIFIPNGKTVVSSQGDVFEDFLNTDGVYCADLFANPKPGALFTDGQSHTIQFDGLEYSDRGKSCIVMQYSNHGITFDLNAIRTYYNHEIDQFVSQVGLIEFDKKRCNANFYVLVDGQLRYSLLGYTQKGVLNDVSVKLEDTDRFLTLVASENVDQIDYMANSTLRDNWCIFTEPVLVFK
jgi:hypothetical protein